MTGPDIARLLGGGSITHYKTRKYRHHTITIKGGIILFLASVLAVLIPVSSWGW